MISSPLEVYDPLDRATINFIPALLLLNFKIVFDFVTCFQSNWKWKLRQKLCFQLAFSLSFTSFSDKILPPILSRSSGISYLKAVNEKRVELRETEMK